MSTCHTLQWARRGAVWLAGWLCVAAAGAAEITLYEHENFGGAQLTLRGYTPNIGSTGFNDRASSLVVRSGRWELCTDNDFRGTCAIFERGEYRTVGSNLNDRISSAREVGSNPDNRGSYSNYGRGAIALFENEGFGGQSVQLEGDTGSLASAGFNDRAESVIVRSGTWQLCANNNFGGTCRTFPPGRYPELGQLARQFSSARLVRSCIDFSNVRSESQNRCGVELKSHAVPSRLVPSRWIWLSTFSGASRRARCSSWARVKRVNARRVPWPSVGCAIFG